MAEAGKALAVAGLVLAAVGLLVWLLGRAGFRGLPGDIRIEGERVKVYIPIVTCLVVSLFITGILWLLNRLSGR